MKDFIIIDYKSEYEEVVNEIEEQQWGVWFDGGIESKIKEGSIVKLALVGDEVVGISYYKPIGDLLYYQAVVVKPEFQYKGLGTAFVTEAIKYAKLNNLKNVFCEAIIVDGKINIESLLKKFEFTEVLRVDNYWGSVSPEVLCIECGCKPCKCGCAFFVKKI